MSAFENIGQHVKDAVFTDIAEHLLQQWIDSNLDEGEYYADKQIAILSGDSEFCKAFNEYYELTPQDEDYMEIEKND